MSVDVQWLVEPAGLDDEAVTKAVQAALEFGERPGIRVSVSMVDDSTLAELHGRCLGDPSPTDVMSFDLGEEGGGPAAEVLVSVDRARTICDERGGALDRELALYLVHGTLHLCGYDDHEPSDRSRMRVAEAEVLRRLGFEDDDRPHDL